MKRDVRASKRNRTTAFPIRWLIYALLSLCAITVCFIVWSSHAVIGWHTPAPASASASTHLHHHDRPDGVDFPGSRSTTLQQPPSGRSNVKESSATAQSSARPLWNGTLPNMAKTGGLIFFLHVPKTGGTTIRDFFASPIMSTRVQYLVGTWRIHFECAVPIIDSYLLHNETSNATTKKARRRILFVEVHGMDNYNALELEPYLLRWRRQAAHNGVPFFAFTVLRDPIAAQVSFFNYYFAPNRDCRFRPSHANLSDAQRLLQVSYDNPQCLFLARGERTFGDRPACPELDAPQHCDVQGGTHHGRWNRDAVSSQLHATKKEYPWIEMADQRSNLTQHECDRVWRTLQRTMDWIGRTQRLSRETLPLLHRLVYGSAQRAGFTPVGKPSAVTTLKVKDLSDAIVEGLLQKSRWDQELLRRVEAVYNYDGGVV